MRLWQTGGDIIFKGFTDETISFMLDIRFNNNKEFMNTNREAYIENLRTPFYELIDTIAPYMLEIDPLMEIRPSKCLSRIFRDTRFTRDKSPYRDHHWVAFRRRGYKKEKVPMYWMELRVENINWGLGFWGPNKTAMDIIRLRIVNKPNELSKYDEMLSKNGFTMQGDTYKRLKPPVELSASALRWYSSKELLFIKNEIDPMITFSPELADVLIKDFTSLKPIYDMMLDSALSAVESRNIR
ncbi:MAG: DUF2461 domain-containing protein [Christensenellales bacterium]